MNHKWLNIDNPQPHKPHSSEVLVVQTSNVTILTMPTESNCTVVEIVELCKAEEIVALNDEEDKENSDANDKAPSTINIHQSPSVAAKFVLEKSMSISLFPDAPTTPKVCRKMLYEDEDDLNTQVKEIVKKYQTSESQQKLPTCCNKETIGECLLCHPKSSSNKPPSLERDKGIIC